MKLLLFDIDGTLVNAHGAGREAVEAAFQDVTGHAIDSGGIGFSGKTDPQIARELLTENGVAPGDEHAAVAGRVLDRYADRLADVSLEGRVEALPGTQALLERLAARGDAVLALLTGNIEPTARLKLRAAGLDRFFPAGGAFGSDDADRDRLVPVATRQVKAHTGHAFSGADVVVIGDTPRDVACGTAHGARTVGVCTGRYARADLEEAGADYVFGDLTNAEHIAGALLRV
jgi:phosphoglycolate phosphatase-like HAD superfamily hydrolase